MATQPFKIDRFAGLNIFQDPTEVGAEAAVAISNADLDRIGRVRCRSGYRVLGSGQTTDLGPMTYFKSSVGSDYIVAVTNAGTTTSQFTTVGTVVSTVAAVPSSNNGFARFGTPGNSILYMGDGSTSIRQLDGTTWSSAAIGFTAEHVAVTPNDNRLAVTGPNSTVSFSDPGQPTTFGVNNFVQLQPGDGEEIMALVTWRDYMIAFKRTKFFVFTGTSTDVDGLPIFNYRAMVAGHGCASLGAAVAGEEGVYFADKTGVFLTNGGVPQYVSQPIEPWLKAGTFTGLPTIGLAAGLTSLVYYERRLYVTDTVNGTTLVYDPALNAWMVWTLTATGMCSIPQAAVSTTAGLYFGEAASNKLAYTSMTTEVTDGGTSDTNGSAVSWSWTSGGYDVSGANRVAVTLESALSGTGTVTLKVANDLGSFDTGSALTLGVSPAVSQAWQQIDREGTFWQHQFSGSGQAIVNRLTHYVSFVKPAGVQ